MRPEDWRALVDRTKKTDFRLEWSEFVVLLPQELPEKIDVYAIGGITDPGWTKHDLDFIIDKDKWYEFSSALGILFEEIFGVSCHVGWKVTEMEPLPVAIKIYSQGILMSNLETRVVVKKEKPIRRPKWIIDLIDTRLKR